MGKWIIGLNVFNEEQLLPECLDSIKKTFPADTLIVAVDGIYQSFAEEAHVLAARNWSRQAMALGDEFERHVTPGPSTDRTLEILKDYKVDRIITSGKPWINEWTKRSEYLKYGEPGDWVFVIDADERIEGKLLGVQEIEAMGSSHYYVNLERDDGSGVYGVFRVHRWKPNMKYDQSHYAMFINGELVNRRDYEKVLLPEIVLKHRWLHRAEITPIRHQIKGEYYRRLMERDELEFRRVHDGF